MITPTANQADGWEKTTAVGAQALTVPVPIGAGTTTSDAIDLGTARLIGIFVPAGWTGTSLTFQGSPDGVSFGTLTDDTGAAITVTVSASASYVIFAKPSQWLGVRFLKVVAAAQVSAGTLDLFALP